MIVEFVLSCGLFVVAVLLFLFVQKRNKNTAQRLILFFFSVTFFYLLSLFAEHYRLETLFQISFLLSNSIGFILGPVIYFYTISLFRPLDIFSRTSLLHFLPFVLHFFFITLAFTPQGFSYEFPFDYLQWVDERTLYFLLLESLYFLVYTAISLVVYLRFYRLLKYRYSNLEQQEFKWSKRMLIGVLITLSLDLLVVLYEMRFGEITWNPADLTLISIALVSTHLAYYGTSQSPVLIPDYLVEQLKKAQNHKLPQKSVASSPKEAKSVLQLSLINVLEEAHPYLEPSLTLSDLAKMIPAKEKTLSALINQEMGTTFYDLINTYRVESIKEKLKSKAYDNYSLQGIAQESGFKSKTSFYRVFKKHTGLTPSQYKAQRSPD